MTRAVQVATVLVLLAYPFLVFFGLVTVGVSGIAVPLALVFLARIVVARWRHAASRDTFRIVAAVGLLLAVVAWLSRDGSALRYYPVLVSVTLFGTFGLSLLRPPTMIERFARLRQPDLAPATVVYAGRVTVVWCAFFLLNALVSMYTVWWGSLEMWTMYNGLISYVLFGILFGVERFVRIFHRRRWE